MRTLEPLLMRILSVYNKYGLLINGCVDDICIPIQKKKNKENNCSNILVY